MKHINPDIEPQEHNLLFVLSCAAQNKIRPPDLNSLFRALGHYHRRMLFEMLCHQQAQIVDLVEITGAPYQAIRKHLIMLRIWARTMTKIIDNLS